MQDRRYLLSIEELPEENISEELRQQCLSLLDETRRQRVLAAKSKRKSAENMGAGLLLQLAVREMLMQAELPMHAEQPERATHMVQAALPGDNICKISLSQLVRILNKYDDIPLPLEYTYSEKGKPFLKDYPYYFNLSHSGSYVFCVISEQEVGVDIQWEKPQAEARIVRRFFSEEEKSVWESCISEEEKRNWFYRMWTRKEAYGKLTGEGIPAAISHCMDTLDAGVIHGDKTDKSEFKQVIFENYRVDNYQMAVCKWK